MPDCTASEASIKDNTVVNDGIIGYTGGGGHSRARVGEAPGVGQEITCSGGLKTLGDSGVLRS